MTKKLEEVAAELRAEYERLKNWRKVAAGHGITEGAAFRIALRGYEPKDAHIRLLLDLPARGEVDVCPECGDPHRHAGPCPTTTPILRVIYEISAEELEQLPARAEIIIKRVKKNGHQRPSRPRASINTKDPQSAASTILRYMSEQDVAALTDLLANLANNPQK